MVVDEGREPAKRRGTVLLIITIFTIASLTVLYIIPPSFTEPNLEVRVAVIDSGIDIDQELESRVAASRSFANTTYGYPEDDNLTSDSNPGGVSHGTYIAKIIASEAPDAAIVNAKVVGENNFATPLAIVEAIRWAVLEENCSVINLSLGVSPISEDFIGNSIRWAFEHGVSIIAAAGNGGQDGVTGSSVESPAIYPEVIAVAAVDDLGSLYSFSARGPLRNRIMKPDIAARGYFQNNGRTVVGTSFAAPVITAGVARIIIHCLSNGWKWTPGMIKAAIMVSASKLPYEEWEVGAGLFDLEKVLLYIDNAQKANDLPLLVSINPTESPFSFERYFANHTTKIPISIFSSSNVTFSLVYRGNDNQWLRGPTSVYVNQTNMFIVDLKVISSISLTNLEASVSLYASGYPNIRFELNFDILVPYRTIAFDISHTPWAIDSSFGQFRELYRTLTDFGIAVDELRYSDNITLDVLSSYDVVFVLDPCAWSSIVNDDGYSISKIGLYTYSLSELSAYESYFAQGGSLFLTALTNSSIDHYNANKLFNLFNITLNNDHIPVITITINDQISTELITKMHDHFITRTVDSFDYNGCSLNYTGDTEEIAWTDVFITLSNGTVLSVNKTVMVSLENTNGGRIVAAGSNFFLDNWALMNKYHSEQNWKIVQRATYWLLHIFS